MKQQSHRLLGRYLIDNLPEQPKSLRTRAFLIGCVEPDSNPLSYLKGSFRSRWFYGHNYQNSDRWIERHIDRLKAKQHWNLWNYYCMGKLIHYTSDAFTYVHNNCFTEPISAHREYENRLQEQFLPRLRRNRDIKPHTAGDLNRFFRNSHENYLRKDADVRRDCNYILNITNWLFSQLVPEACSV
ncbi:MAG: zinc dependent phospholipase C family protein [Candidatus Limivicinus sp.]|jgi:hypothetical protein